MLTADFRRIGLNVAATYGRSLVALVCGLLGARWVLQALGQVDYGLWGVIGGLVGFVSFFNGLMAQAVARFLAVAVGRASAQGGEVEGDVRDWFWTAVIVPPHGWRMRSTAGNEALERLWRESQAARGNVV